MNMGSPGSRYSKTPTGNISNASQPNMGALIKPATNVAQTAAKAGKVKSIKLKIKMKQK